MPESGRSSLPRLALAYALAITAGLLALWARIPLPWMIGPLLVTAASSLAGRTPRVPKITRPIGQVIVASSVGMSFTAAALAALVDRAALMVALALVTIVLGLAVAALLSRFARLDAVTASLACVPVGPVETAHLAEHYGREPGPVIFAQTLRVALVVLLVPPLVVWLDAVAVARAPAVFDPLAGVSVKAALLLLACVCGSLIFRRLRVPNPFFLGALAVSSLAAIAGVGPSAYPVYLLAAGQVLLGVWLGAAFDQKLLRRAGTLLPALIASTSAFLLLCIGAGLSMTFLFGIRWEEMVLSAAPGSVTEMALTANLIGADATTVTAFHVVRIFIVIPAAPFLIALVRRIAEGPATVAEKSGRPAE